MEFNFVKTEKPADYEMSNRVSKYEQPVTDFLKSGDEAQKMDCGTESQAKTAYKGFYAFIHKDAKLTEQVEVKRRGSVLYLVRV